MSVAVVIAIAVVAIAAAIVAARAARHPAGIAPAPAAAVAAGWTADAGADFAGLSETARCEMIFALAALDDPSSQATLERALGDPSETVVLAAAHALAERGDAPAVERYFAAHPGERATRIAAILALMGNSARPTSS